MKLIVLTVNILFIKDAGIFHAHMTSSELLYGFTGPPPLQTKLTAGPFTMLYENGFIRHIKYGNNEIIRMIYTALRDENWGTYLPIIENEKLVIHPHSFIIQYQCRYKKNDTDLFKWEVIIEGDAAGKIMYSISGTAFADFLKNRAGFCILHPVKNTAGQPVILTHQDGSTKTAFFPVAIASQNPFKDITKLQWRHQGHDYVIKTEGDIFEMEDHRNWTDTSFKTFCTPLSLPFPVQIKTGDLIRQQIYFGPLTPLPVIQSTDKSYITVTIKDGNNKKMPDIGIGASTEIMHPSKQVLAGLAKINFNHYCIEIKPASEGWQEYLTNQLYIGRQMATTLFITIDLGTDYDKEFAAFTELMTGCKERLRYILILERGQPVTSSQIIEWAKKKVKQIFPSVLLGIGTPANFAELNRNRRVINNIDFVSYAIHPQEHAFDNLSLIENLESQADTIASAQLLYPATGICISPVTLRKRINPYAQNNADHEQTNEQKSDPRQISLWAAGWTLASVKYLSEAGATVVTYFQTAGKQGICNGEGALYPTASLLQLLLAPEKATVIKTDTDEPLQCSSLLLATGNTRYLFLANHSSYIRKIKLPFPITTIDQVEWFPSAISHSRIEETDIIDLAPWTVAKLS